MKAYVLCFIFVYFKLKKKATNFKIIKYSTWSRKPMTIAMRQFLSQLLRVKWKFSNKMVSHLALRTLHLGSIRCKCNKKSSECDSRILWDYTNGFYSVSERKRKKTNYLWITIKILNSLLHNNIHTYLIKCDKTI